MTEPTDAELIALLGDRQFSSIGAVREALRRWGTPPAVAGEPVAWLSTDCIGERYLCFTKPKDSNPARPLVFGDTTPHPTQAVPPAGREPQCWCLTCRPMRFEDPCSIRMALCPACGNKRCPKANDHRNTCSGSNVPGQHGSIYK